MIVYSQCATPMAIGVARAIPATNKILSGVTNVVITDTTLSRCLKRCMEQQCPAFNYGENRCELLNSYLCEGDGALTDQPNHRYYDVETGDLVEVSLFVCLMYVTFYQLWATVLNISKLNN